MKAIQSIYKNVKFRSRLEVRWAVFFDALGIEWLYEPEGFDLDGEWYLPDFFLPSFNGGTWCEVKPHEGDFSKAKRFVEKTKKSIWLCEGNPEMRVTQLLCWAEVDPALNSNLFKKKSEAGFIESFTVIPLFDQAEGENRFFWEPGYENSDGTIPEEYWISKPYRDAVIKANGLLDDLIATP